MNNSITLPKRKQLNKCGETRYERLCELCGRLRPQLVMTPDGPVWLCNRCAYRLGYTRKGGRNGA
jgi:uncharacterized cysteine cluster protein YcgN (CxxCxxCC family)